MGNGEMRGDLQGEWIGLGWASMGSSFAVMDVGVH